MSKFYDEERAWETALLCQPREKLQNETPIYAEARSAVAIAKRPAPVIVHENNLNDEEFFFPEFYGIDEVILKTDNKEKINGNDAD